MLIYLRVVSKRNAPRFQIAQRLYSLLVQSVQQQKLFLRDMSLDTQAKTDLATKFWSQVEIHIPIWTAIKAGELKPSDIRQTYICSLSVVLVAIGAGGNALIRSFSKQLGNAFLSRLDAVDWGKGNPIWQDLIFVNGRVAA